MRRIALLNQKGGVGKTTTVANLGACLARMGRRVLVVDMDPQGNLSLHFGIEVERGEPSVYTLLRQETELSDVIRETVVERLQLIPSNIDLAGLEVELAAAEEGREMRLSRALQPLEGGYDYVLIDCPPSLGLLTLNAMCAVRELFIALQAQFFALRGLCKLTETYRLVRARLNPALEITGIAACILDLRTSLSAEVMAEIKSHFGNLVFKTIVRNNVRVAEAPSFGVPVIMYDEHCHGAQDYSALAEEVLAMEGVGPVQTPSVDPSAPCLASQGTNVPEVSTDDC